MAHEMNVFGLKNKQQIEWINEECSVFLQYLNSFNARTMLRIYIKTSLQITFTAE